MNDAQLNAAEAEVMPFGKYKGKTLGWIANNDILYLDWLVGQDIQNVKIRLGVGAICQARAGEIEQAMEEQER